MARPQDAETESGGSVVKRTRLRPISSKRAKTLPLRRKLVQEHLENIPYCEATLLGVGCTFNATDVHEVVSRGRRPGAELDPTLYVSLCRTCHTWLTSHPDWSQRHGYSLHAMANDSEVEQARVLRSLLPCNAPASKRHLCPEQHND